MTNDNTNSRMNRRSFVKWAGVSGVGLASVGSASATGKGKEWDKSPLRVYVKRKEGKKYLYVKNVSKRTVQVRDIDSAGVDFITGRPELKSGETKKFRAKKKGKYVLRAYSPKTGKPKGKKIVKKIERRKDGDGEDKWEGKSPLRVYVKRKEGKKYLYVKNVSKRTVQVRDIDSEGVDFITGRPELKSGETKKFRAKKKGKYVLRAYSPRTGKPLGKRIVKEIKRRKDGDGRKDGRHKDGKKDDRHKKKRDRYDGDKKDDREDEKDDEKKRKRGRWH